MSTRSLLRSLLWVLVGVGAIAAVVGSRRLHRGFDVSSPHNRVSQTALAEGRSQSSSGPSALPAIGRAP